MKGFGELGPQAGEGQQPIRANLTTEGLVIPDGEPRFSGGADPGSSAKSAEGSIYLDASGGFLSWILDRRSAEGASLVQDDDPYWVMLAPMGASTIREASRLAPHGVSG